MPDTPTAADLSRSYGAGRIAATVLAPFGFGYFLSYLFRTVNVVIAPELARDLSLGAADLGLLSSIYFFVVAGFQAPLGMLLDRYGPVRVQLALLLFAAAGALLFAVGDSFLPVAVGRGLIGLGVCGCLMAAIKANVLWWPRDKLPLVNGIVGACGSFGALSATVPVEMALELTGWRSIFIILAAVTVALVVVTWLVVPDRNTAPAGGHGGFSAQLRELGRIYGSGYFWRICIMAFVHTAVFLGYQTLWMGAWLRDVAEMGGGAAAQALLWFNVGMAAGVLSIGAVSERLQRVGIAPVQVIAVGMAVSIAVQAALAFEATALALPLCIAFGYFGSSGLLIYAVLGQTFPAHLVGRALTAQNMMVFVGAFAAQWGVGVIINLWPPLADGHYAPEGHKIAFLVVIAAEVAALAWFVVSPHKVDNRAHAKR